MEWPFKTWTASIAGAPTGTSCGIRAARSRKRSREAKWKCTRPSQPLRCHSERIASGELAEPVHIDDAKACQLQQPATWKHRPGMVLDQQVLLRKRTDKSGGEIVFCLERRTELQSILGYFRGLAILEQRCRILERVRQALAGAVYGKERSLSVPRLHEDKGINAAYTRVCNGRSTTRPPHR